MQDTLRYTYMEDGEENEEGIDNESHNIWQSCEGERHVYVCVWDSAWHRWGDEGG